MYGIIVYFDYWYCKLCMCSFFLKQISSDHQKAVLEDLKTINKKTMNYAKEHGMEEIAVSTKVMYLLLVIYCDVQLI